jgi:tetratricopeptide (TPR) repeat protein
VLASLLALCAGLAWKLRLERETSRLYLAQDYERQVVAAAMKLLRGEWVLATGGMGASAREYLLPRRYQDLLVGSGKLVAEEVVTDLTRAVEDLPERFEGYYYRAKGRKLLGDNAGAIGDLRECLGRNPGFSPAKALLADLEGPADGREGPTRPPPPDGSDHWSGAWLRAHRAMQEENWKEAAPAYGELLAFEEGMKGEIFLGSSIENLIERGVARLQTSDFEDAKLDFWAARTLSQRLWGDFLEPLLLLGKVYFLARDPSRTESLFLEALGRASDREKTALWMAAVYQSLVHELTASERLAEAVVAARGAAQSHAEDAAARLNFGWALLREQWSRRDREANAAPAGTRETLQEIESLVAEVLARDANESTAYFLWSKALEAQGELDRAHELSEKAEALRGRTDTSRRQDMNTRNIARIAAVAATLSLGLAVEGRAQHAPEGSFTEVTRLGDPVLGDPVNSPLTDALGGVSGDGLTLLFTSTRPGGSGGADIYLANRLNTGDPFMVERNFAELNTSSDEWVAFLSSDALRLY